MPQAAIICGKAKWDTELPPVRILFGKLSNRSFYTAIHWYSFRSVKAYSIENINNSRNFPIFISREGNGDLQKVSVYSSFFLNSDTKLVNFCIMAKPLNYSKWNNIEVSSQAMKREIAAIHNH